MAVAVPHVLTMNLPEPPQPEESAWRFVQELQAPLWSRHHWKPRPAGPGEVLLAEGVVIRRGFADEAGALETAYKDLERFFAAGGVRCDGGYEIIAEYAPTDRYEAFAVEVGPRCCRIMAADSEGIRRGIFHIEDAMLRAGGAFLITGAVTRRPVVRTRISRCFFGPVKRPPKNRDELLDETNYYPDEYLNRLAHDGVNALWLSVEWKDLCRTLCFPEQGRDAERRLGRLRDTVRRCARYGIRIYIFGIEPRAAEYEKDERYPELKGHTGAELTYFCTSSEMGKRYIEEALYGIFSAVPGLGGFINISLGERGTHCYSDMLSLSGNNCSRCGRREPWEVFAETLSLMARGMHRANPQAELVSWLYLPYWPEEPGFDVERCKEQVRLIAAHTPPEVTLQLNFESGSLSHQFGRQHTVCDYSLAFVGPSDLFGECATAAVQNGARSSAKLQVGCSHEVATVPFVPAPGNLYRKYSAIHELGVSTVMQCWYFGNYPSPMTKAAGLLAFEPLPESEAQFLGDLAALSWGGDAPVVARAWGHFREAYAAFPSALQFAWFGPVHDSICWPLHLIPVDLPIAPSWKITFPPSGDRIGECFAAEFTLHEILQSCRSMAATWEKGAALLRPLVEKYADQPERLAELGICEALALQLRSAWNVLRFYALREELPWLNGAHCLQHLHAMKQLVRDEIAGSRRLAELASRDSRLGYHSEAEGYKYFPAKLHWRAGLLERLLEADFPEVEELAKTGEPLFAEYAGIRPRGRQYQCALMAGPAGSDGWESLPEALCASAQGLDAREWRTAWQGANDEARLYVRISCASPQAIAPATADRFFDNEHLALVIEPRRLWPVQRYFVNRHGATHHQTNSTVSGGEWSANVQATPNGWEALFSIPFASLRAGVPAGRPLRINIERHLPGRGVLRWCELNPLPARLIFNDDNSADYGWLLPAPGVSPSPR